MSNTRRIRRRRRRQEHRHPLEDVPPIVQKPGTKCVCYMGEKFPFHACKICHGSGIVGGPDWRKKSYAEGGVER